LAGLGSIVKKSARQICRVDVTRVIGHGRDKSCFICCAGMLIKPIGKWTG
jgi:hypothetical protein